MSFRNPDHIPIFGALVGLMGGIPMAMFGAAVFAGAIAATSLFSAASADASGLYLGYAAIITAIFGGVLQLMKIVFDAQAANKEIAASAKEISRLTQQNTGQQAQLDQMQVQLRRAERQIDEQSVVIQALGVKSLTLVAQSAEDKKV